MSSSNRQGGHIFNEVWVYKHRWKKQQYSRDVHFEASGSASIVCHQSLSWKFEKIKKAVVFVSHQKGPCAFRAQPFLLLPFQFLRVWLIHMKCRRCTAKASTWRVCTLLIVPCKEVLNSSDTKYGQVSELACKKKPNFFCLSPSLLASSMQQATTTACKPILRDLVCISSIIWSKRVCPSLDKLRGCQPQYDELAFSTANLWFYDVRKLSLAWCGDCDTT